MLEERVSSARALVRVLAGAEPIVRHQAALDVALDRLRHATKPADVERLDKAIWKLWGAAGTRSAIRLLQKAMQSLATERFSLAIEALDTAIKLDFAFAEAWNRRATVYYLLGEYEKAIDDIEHVLILEPRHYGALSGLGQIFVRSGDITAAIEAFEAALDINPHLTSVRSVMDHLLSEVAREQRSPPLLP